MSGCSAECSECSVSIDSEKFLDKVSSCWVLKTKCLMKSRLMTMFMCRIKRKEPVYISRCSDGQGIESR
jgi:hypothetical protein